MPSACGRLRRKVLLPGYDDWVSPERQRLADEYVDAMICLADLLRRLRPNQEAIEYARKAVAVDPIHEQAACGLVDFLASLPDAAGCCASTTIRSNTTLWKEPDRTVRGTR